MVDVCDVLERCAAPLETPERFTDGSLNCSGRLLPQLLPQGRQGKGEGPLNVLRRRRSDELRRATTSFKFRDTLRAVAQGYAPEFIPHKVEVRAFTSYETQTRGHGRGTPRHSVARPHAVRRKRTPWPRGPGGPRRYEQLGERGSGDRTDDGEDIPFVLGVPQVSARPRDRRCGLRTWADLAPSSLRRSSSYSPRSAGAAAQIAHF